MLSVLTWWDALCQSDFNKKNAKTLARKGLILYNSANGITTLKEHVYVNHCMITKMFEEVNSLLKDVEKHLQKKDLM
jgi:hypothetical protein